jgi:hypothetical protein
MREINGAKKKVSGTILAFADHKAAKLSRVRRA